MEIKCSSLASVSLLPRRFSRLYPPSPLVSTLYFKKTTSARFCDCGTLSSSPRWIWTFSHCQSLHLQRDIHKLCGLSWRIFKASASIGDMTILPSEFTDESIILSKLNIQDAVSKEDGISNNKVDVETLCDQKMVRICDKLIDVFMVDKPKTIDWRRLLAFSMEWDNIRPHFYNRCQEKADEADNPEMKHKLHRLGRKLKEVDDDVQRHNELLKVIKMTPTAITEIISKRRKDFTREFFQHLHTVAESYYANPIEQNALAKLGNACLAAVQAYDSTSESIEALNVANEKFQDIINSPTLDVACGKIDTLAEKNQLDSALMLMLSKAWSATKETDMMKDEAKDIMYHLYMSAKGNLQRLVPKEIRILKYLLTIEDPQERIRGLNDAFTPGIEIEGKDMDSLYTTPEKLFTWIQSIINAYHSSKEGTLVKEARDLMNPLTIKRMEILHKLIRDKFM
ncbi:hypothetical protein ZOSMA_93G00600 [Zostera marina]|uniref:Uncharacterized protein n=1 Tax=Zostera marina TaxID=29655 RepID=A0A0K9NIN0_ZOSMR|nr:hypothetical protein ZOSMA_93G00600 [Zostera marina]